MYNSKEMVVDPELTFLSYNQTINAEFRLEDIIDSPLWIVNSDNGLIKAIPLFNCDKITSSNSSDRVLDSNKCIIMENVPDTLVKCISNDTGGMHYHSIELYSYCPYTSLDLVDDVTVYCILYDEYLNTVGNVDVDVYLDDELSESVVSDSNGVCRFSVDQACSVKFVYGELESNSVVIDESQIYTLSIETDKQSLFTDESVTVTGVLTVDGEVYADQSVALYDGSSLIDTVVTDSNGEYSKTVSGLSVGVHTFKAVHSNVESSTISITVNEPTHVYALSASANPSTTTYGNDVTVSGAYTVDGTGVSGETITIYDGDTVLGTTTTDTGGAYSKTISGLSIGSHSLKASHTNVDSTPVSVTINKITTTTTISASSSSILTTDSLILSGSITGATTGTVKIYNNDTLIATETVSSGTYSKTLTGLTVGSYSFYTVFQEDSTHASSTSTSVSVTVSEPSHDYNLALACSTPVIQTGGSASVVATLTDNGVAVSGETLSYEIKHGSTVIDSGSDVTDSDGQVEIGYTGTGVGDVEVTVSYASLEETFTIKDYVYYDNCSSDKGKWVKSDATKIDYSFSNGVMLIQGLGSSSDSFLNLNINYPSNYEMEITIAETLSYYSCGIRCSNVGLEAESARKYLQTYSPYSYSSDSGTLYANDVIKFVVENGTVTLYINNTQKRQATATNDGFRFSSYQSRQLKVKEIKIKAL